MRPGGASLDPRGVQHTQSRKPPATRVRLSACHAVVCGPCPAGRCASDRLSISARTRYSDYLRPKRKAVPRSIEWKAGVCCSSATTPAVATSPPDDPVYAYFPPSIAYTFAQSWQVSYFPWARRPVAQLASRHATTAPRFCAHPSTPNTATFERETRPSLFSAPAGSSHIRSREPCCSAPAAPLADRPDPTKRAQRSGPLRSRPLTGEAGGREGKRVSSAPRPS